MVFCCLVFVFFADLKFHEFWLKEFSFKKEISFKSDSFRPDSFRLVSELYSFNFETFNNNSNRMCKILINWVECFFIILILVSFQFRNLISFKSISVWYSDEKIIEVLYLIKWFLVQTILSAYSLYVFWNLTMKEQIAVSIFITEKDDVLKIFKIFLSAEF